MRGLQVLACLAFSQAATRCNPSSWPDLDTHVCGECKALVKWGTYGYTCGGYCSGIGHTCVNGWEETGDTCDVKYHIGCDRAVDSSDAICECAAGSDGTDATSTSRCDPSSWPDLDTHVCGACKALVKWDNYGATCSGYCSGIGHTCVNGWEETGDTCDVKYHIGCDRTVDSSDAICECAAGSDGTDATCESYYVSGSKHHDEMYIARGECEGKALYECVGCSLSNMQYLYYSSKYDGWRIGPGGCGMTSFGMYTVGSNSGDLGLAQWKELSGGEWVEPPRLKLRCSTSPWKCESKYVVSGSRHHSDKHGTYVPNGECDGKTLYKCEDCSSSDDQYLFYYAPFKVWHIGNGGCGSPNADLFAHATSDDPSSHSTRWSETSGPGWLANPVIYVGQPCFYAVTLFDRGSNFAAIVGEAVSEASTPSIAMMLIIGMLCGSVVAFLHFLRKQPRKNADETPLLHGGEAI